MKKRLIINENHMIEFLNKEFNKNEIGVYFLYSNWIDTRHEDENGEIKGNLIIQRMTFDEGRFDVMETYNEETYATNETEITPIDFGNLNTEFIHHPQIVQVNFNPVVSILVCADYPDVLMSNRIALEELRAKFMQYHTHINVSNLNLDYEGLDGQNEYLNDLYDVIINAGEIDYGGTQTINGRNYIQMSIELVISVTNRGFFSNNQRLLFGVDEIVDDNGEVIMFETPLLTWHWGTVLETNDYQLVNTMRNTRPNLMKRSAEALSSPQSKGFAITIYIQPDLYNEFEALLYKSSYKRKNKVNKFYIDFQTYLYNKETKQNELWDSEKRTYLLPQNSPPTEVSLGEVISLALTFSPTDEEE